MKPLRRITAKYNGKCWSCSAAIIEGNPIFYGKERDKPHAYCLECGERINAAPSREGTRTPDAAPDTPIIELPEPTRTPETPPEARKRPTEHLTTFDTFDAFIDHCETSERVKQIEGDGSTRDAEQWNGHVNLAGAIDLARRGWPDGYADVRSLVVDAKTRRTGSARRDAYTLNVAGYFPEVGAFVSGSPMCMVDVDAGREIATSVVRITVQLMTPAWVDAQYIMNFGAALCVLVESIEMKGTSVELVGAFDTQHRTRNRTLTNILRVRLKTAGQPLDVDRLCFMVAHPASMRHLAFKTMESTPFCKPFIGTGYGSPALHKTGTTDCVCIRKGAQNSPTVDAAIAYVSACYAEADTNE